MILLPLGERFTKWNFNISRVEKTSKPSHIKITQYYTIVFPIKSMKTYKVNYKISYSISIIFCAFFHKKKFTLKIYEKIQKSIERMIKIVSFFVDILYVWSYNYLNISQ